MCQNNNQLEPMQSEQQVETAAEFLLCDCSLSWLFFVNLINDSLVPQKKVQNLQTAVDSLQKEKDNLVLALQSAKKDTNQAKYA